MIILDSKSQLTLDIIAKVSEGKITISNATKLLNLSQRTIERYLNQYHKHGVRFIIHGNTGKKPSNKIFSNTLIKYLFSSGNNDFFPNIASILIV